MDTNKTKYTYLREVELRYKFKKVNNKIIGKQALDPKTVVQLFSDMQNESKEKLIAISLDSRNNILCYEVVAIGSVNTIYQRIGEMFRTAIPVSAVAMIVVHNQPSGDPTPSEADRKFTEDLQQAAGLLGIPLYDHIIIGLDSYFSFAEEEQHITLA